MPPRLAVSGAASGPRARNLCLAVAAAAVAAACAPGRGGEPPVAPRWLVLVGPFQDQGPDPHDMGVALGLPGEIQAALAGLPGVSAQAAPSSPGAVEHALPAFLLRGLVRWAGGGVHVDVWLADPAGQSLLWRQMYSRGRGDDPVSVRRELGAAIARDVAEILRNLAL